MTKADLLKNFTKLCITCLACKASFSHGRIVILVLEKLTNDLVIIFKVTLGKILSVFRNRAPSFSLLQLVSVEQLDMRVRVNFEVIEKIG